MSNVRIVLAVVAAIVAGSNFEASAQNLNYNDNTNVNINSSRARANANSRSASVSGSQSTSSVNITNSAQGNRTRRLVTPPTVAPPALAAAGIETCLGSVSGGASFMGGGFSFGTTTKDDDCNRRLYARQLHNMGYGGAAIAIQCLSPEVNYAMAVAGTPCAGPAPQVAQRGAVVSAYAGLSTSPTDTSAAPDGFKWVPNPEYADWQREQAKPRRVGRH